MPNLVMEFDGLSNSLDRTKIGPSKAWQMKNCNPDKGILQADWGYDKIASIGTDAQGYGLTYNEYAAASEFILSATKFTPSDTYEGTFKLQFTRNDTGQSEMTQDIRWDADPGDVASAFDALNLLQVGDFDVSGGTLPGTAHTIRFVGSLVGVSCSLELIAGGLGSTYSGNYSLTQLLTGGVYKSCFFVKETGGYAAMYRVDRGSDDTWSDPALVRSGLNKVDYSFQPYDDRIYAAGYRSGILKYRFGAAIDVPENTVPTPGGLRDPQFLDRVQPVITKVKDVNWTAAVGAGWTAGTVISYSAGNLQITIGSASTNAGTGLIELTATDIDFAFSDVWKARLIASVTTQSNIQFADRWMHLVNMAGDTIDAKDELRWFERREYYDNLAWLNFTWESKVNAVTAKSRESRKQCRKIVLRFAWSKLSASEIFTVSLENGGTWVLDKKSLVPPGFDRSRDGGPTGDTASTPLFAWSYYQSWTGQEGPLSVAFGPLGNGSTPIMGQTYVLGLGRAIPKYPIARADKVRFYAFSDETKRFHRIPKADLETFEWDNDGADITYPGYMRDEISAFPVYQKDYEVGFLSISRRAECLGNWKGTLVIGANKKIFVSGVGLPEEFHGDPDVPGDQWDPEVPEIAGRVDYASPNRSENPVSVIGKDSLYILTDRAAGVITGGIPSTASVVRQLPNSKGILGSRAACSKDGGVLAGTNDGLYYYSIGRGLNAAEDSGAMIARELTDDVRASWQRLIATGKTTLVVRQHEDEIWCFCENRYLRFTRNGRWLEGEYPVDVVDAVSIPGYGLLFQGNDGAIYRLHKDALNHDRTDIDWYWDGGYLIGERVRVTGVGSYQDNKPVLTLYIDDGKAGERVHTLTLGNDYHQFWVRPMSDDDGRAVLPGFRERVKITGDNANVKLHHLMFELDKPGPGKGN